MATQVTLNSGAVSSAGSLKLQTNGTTDAVTIDTAQNLGLGVTPSSWALGKAFEVGFAGNALWGNATDSVFLTQNMYYDGNFRYKNTAAATNYQQTVGQHRWFTAGSGTAGNPITFTQAMTLDASGNLVIGDTSTSYKLDLAKLSATTTEAAIRNTNGRMVLTQQSGGGAVTQYYKDAAATYVAGVGSTVPGGSAQSALIFSDYQGSWVERARIDSSGNLLVGTTSGTINGSSFGTSVGAGYIQSSRNVNGSDSTCKFFGNAGALYIQGNGNALNTNNSYGSLSDAKLKENITDATPKLAQLNQVRIVNYNLIGDDKKQIGVIAQELEQVFPSMIDESVDRDEEGNDLGTTTKSVKYSVFVPMLIKAIQELKAIVDAQAAEIAALKG